MSGVSRQLLARIRTWRDRRRVLKSGLFDAAWYRQAHLGLQPHVDPALHFLHEGAQSGLSPHPLFDTAWYAQQYPDVVREGANPLLHYLMSGAAEGRDPNAYFSSTWYLSAYPDVAGGGANPLAHYAKHGGREGRRPSPRFDPAFYLTQLPPEAAGRKAPLTHFLTIGRSEGLQPAPQAEELEGEPVEWAELTVLKAWRPSDGREVALFVTHAPAGRLKPYVRLHLDALRRAQVEVILIVAGEASLIDEAATGDLAGLYVRENVGFDFAAWAHLLKLHPQLWDAPGLYLLNDSVIGPVGEEAYQAMIGRIRASHADLVSLTESRERAWHLQSYFMFLRATALTDARVHRFFNRIRSLHDKQAVIDRYEVALAGEVIDAGLRTDVLFRKGAGANPTLFAWRELLDEGFPFLKASVATGRHEDVDNAGWRETLEVRGFDVRSTDALFEPDPPAAPVRLARAEPAPWTPARIAFYGPWNYANGLGEAGRGYLSALWRLDGASLNLHGVKKPFHIHRRLCPAYDVRDFVEAADAVIVHLNPDGWHFLSDEQRGAIAKARVRIGIWVWEMDQLPDVFLPHLDEVDVIWAPSRYCAQVFAAATDRPVHVIPHVVAVPPEASPKALDRTILYIFDGSSYLVRKNPLALVEAFALSGLARRGWRLVLKTKNLGDHPAQAQQLAERCAEAAGVTLIDRAMSREQIADLFEAAAIYASPHASEGFGLTIAEAMAAGKVVVATDYGGSRDVLDESCGFPVAYDLTTLTQDFGHYRRGGRWAAVRHDALAAALVQAADGLEAGGHTLGSRARARIAERLSASAVAKAMQASFARIAPLAAGIEARRP